MLGKKLKKELLMAGLLLLVFSQKVVANADDYGPPLPKGYIIPVEQPQTVAVKPVVTTPEVKADTGFTQSLLSAWERFTSKVSEFGKAMVSSAPKSQKSDDNQPTRQLASNSSNPVSFDDLLNFSRSVVRSSSEAFNVSKIESLKVAKTNIPELNEPKNFNPRLVKPFNYQPLVAEAALVLEKKREKFNSKELAQEDLKLPSAKVLSNEHIKLITIESKELNSIDIISRDQFTLINGLFAWLFNRELEASETIFNLANNSKTQSLVREKAFSFMGWMFEVKNLKAFASLSFSHGLDQSPLNNESKKYDELLAQSLSDQAKLKNHLAKAFFKTSTFSKLSNATSLSPATTSYAQMVLADAAFDHKNFSQARKYAQMVATKSAWKENARYLASISLMLGKDSKENLETAGKELTELFRTVDNSEVFDATAVTLGRIHFILGNYQAAHKYLSQVSRETNLYIEATVDNAWALLRAGDRNHAVGNMFTLHTPYFDSAYMPESYFIRSLGYQEICQFGDAMTSVKLFKTKYSDSYKKIGEFNNGGKTDDQSYYQELVNFLTKKETKLTAMVLKELGRHPEFFRRQKNLNTLAQDEKQVAIHYNKIANSIIEWAKPDFSSLRSNYKTEIAQFLKKKSLAIEQELKFLVANISLLEYEIFAGASSNLALQGAKNFAVDEKQAQAKRSNEDGKELWPYEDEIWEDELNNFRSKMVDACAKAKQQEHG